jgi:hypothetical protein
MAVLRREWTTVRRAGSTIDPWAGASHAARYNRLVGSRHTLAAILVTALASACSSSSTSNGGSGAGMGAACTCPNEPDAGDFLCGGQEYTSCASPLTCIDGVCSTFCQVDAGTCPSGYVCKQPPNSNATTYCAPTGGAGPLADAG